MIAGGNMREIKFRAYEEMFNKEKEVLLDDYKR
jgi:hypothetical protein